MSEIRLSDSAADKLAEVLTDMVNRVEGDWEKPWLQSGAYRDCPRNAAYRKPYKGCNEFFVALFVSMRGYQTPYFLTYDQLHEMGLKLNVVDTDPMGKPWEDGKTHYEQSFPILHWTPVYTNKKDGTRLYKKQFDELPDEEKENYRVHLSCRCYGEWNLDQTNYAEVYPDKFAQLVEHGGRVEKSECVENVTDDVLDEMIEWGTWRCPIAIEPEKGTDEGAYYVPKDDRIHLPNPSWFQSRSKFYGTALHEMAHSTKGEENMNRDYGRKQWGDEGYALEELVAELSAAIMMYDLQLDKQIDEEHLKYVKSWRTHIQDKDSIQRVIGDVMRVTKYMLHYYDTVYKTMTEVA